MDPVRRFSGSRGSGDRVGRVTVRVSCRPSTCRSPTRPRRAPTAGRAGVSAVPRRPFASCSWSRSRCSGGGSPPGSTSPGPLIVDALVFTLVVGGVLELVLLPFGIARHRLSREVGISRQSVRQWLVDLLKGGAARTRLRHGRRRRRRLARARRAALVVGDRGRGRDRRRAADDRRRAGAARADLPALASARAGAVARRPARARVARRCLGRLGARARGGRQDGVGERRRHGHGADAADRADGHADRRRRRVRATRRSQRCGRCWGTSSGTIGRAICGGSRCSGPCRRSSASASRRGSWIGCRTRLRMEGRARSPASRRLRSASGSSGCRCRSSAPRTRGGASGRLMRSGSRSPGTPRRSRGRSRGSAGRISPSTGRRSSCRCGRRIRRRASGSPGRGAGLRL